MSTIFWAVFDEEQKNKSEEILATFDKDSKDEIGLMSITIALSNLMFPGTSVLHTRLRYVFLVGWIFLEAAKSGISNKELHKKEKILRRVLQKAKDGGNEPSENFLGILGATKIINEKDNGEDLSQPPFSVYFNLLKTWGIIIEKNISVNEVAIQSFNDTYFKIVNNLNFHNNTFVLSEYEKNILFEFVPESILKSIFHRDIIYDVKQYFIDFNAFSILTGEQQDIFRKAQNFSILMWGGMLHYNYFLGNESEDLKKRYVIWKERVKSLVDSDWKPKDTYCLVENEANDRQKSFIDEWFQYVTKNKNNLTLEAPPHVYDNLSLLQFLTNREKHLKGDRSRLAKKEKITDAKFGINPIEYRWSNVMRFKKDFDSASN